jgi:hypothetical protein
MDGLCHNFSENGIKTKYSLSQKVKVAYLEQQVNGIIKNISHKNSKILYSVELNSSSRIWVDENSILS